jgi:hypothetical protein
MHIGSSLTNTLINRWDFATSVEEVMTRLHSYVMSKQVLYLGVSDTPAWVVVKANECTYNLSSASTWLHIIANPDAQSPGKTVSPHSPYTRAAGTLHTVI